MRRRGVTVLEALVGVAIMIVIAAICYPAVRAITGRAQQTNCAEKLHTLGNGFALYATDHDGYLPAATTAEWAYRDVKDIPAGELAASPAKLRDVMKTYVPGDPAWFCPIDPEKGHNVLWLGQRHRLTSYLFNPKSSGSDPAWPPHMLLGRANPTNAKGEDIPLISDAFGIPSIDSDRRFRGDTKPASNHDDGMVNVIRQDLSLVRHSAKFITSIKE